MGNFVHLFMHKRRISMSMLQDNQIARERKEKALEIYNISVDKSTSVQQQCADKLKNLYMESLSKDVADYYAMSLFNLSLRVSTQEMQWISAELENLFEKNPTECIAEQIGRLKFNLSIQMTCDARTLKKYAVEIEKLYHQYPTNALAEPLAKIWYSILASRACDQLEYANRIIELCSHISDPETNTAYAKVLFDSKIPIDNRNKLIDQFLSNSQVLESFQSYVESAFFPHHNKALVDFKLAPSYPTKLLTTKVNRALGYLKRRSNYTELKVEILSLLYYALRIKRLLIVPKTNDLIGHYTKIENLKHLILPGNEVGKLRMSNAAYMNDPSEGRTLIDFLSNSNKEENANLYMRDNSNIYVSCFTTSIDELPMWSMYGNDGKGCCLVFKGDYFDYTYEDTTHDFLLSGNKADESNYLYRVCYLSYSPKDFTIAHEEFDEDFTKNPSGEIANAINLLKNHYDKIISLKSKSDKVVDGIIALILNQIRYLFKDWSYAHERELRLIKYSESPMLDQDSWIVPQLYVEVARPLEYTQVILGPKVDQTNRITPYLTYTGKVKEVRKSKIKYR